MEGANKKQKLEVKNNKAVILIGGPSRGTRFRPFSLSSPKQLFPLAGEPIIFHHIEACSKIPGLTEIILIGFYEASLFSSFISETEQKIKHIKISYLREHLAMGTGGGLYHFRDQILRGKPDAFFVIHSDVCYDFDLSEMLRFHRDHDKSIVTIGSKKVPKDKAHNYGCLVVADSGEVTHYVEKPETFVSEVISCGIYIFSPAVFEKLGEVFQKKNDITSGSEQSDEIQLEKDLFEAEAGNGAIFSFHLEGRWGQIKSGSSTLPMNEIYLHQKKIQSPEQLAKNKSEGPTIDGMVYIHPTAKVHATAKLGPNVSIGPNSIIGDGARVKNSIILDGVKVKGHACILNSVIGSQSTIGEWSRIEGGGLNSYEASFAIGGSKKDIVTLLGEDVSVGNEVVVRNCVVLPHKEIKTNSFSEIIM